MHKQGLLSREYVQQHMPPEVLSAVMEFYVEETAMNDYRPRTPYVPPSSLAVLL